MKRRRSLFKEWESGKAMDIALYYAPITSTLVPYITPTEAGAEFEVRPLTFEFAEAT